MVCHFRTQNCEKHFKYDDIMLNWDIIHEHMHKCDINDILGMIEMLLTCKWFMCNMLFWNPCPEKQFMWLIICWNGVSYILIGTGTLKWIFDVLKSMLIHIRNYGNSCVLINDHENMSY